ncbi:MAG: hypothetical protein ACO4B3_13315, partial [Planctomycetota bacterium]
MDHPQHQPRRGRRDARAPSSLRWAVLVLLALLGSGAASGQTALIEVGAATGADGQTVLVPVLVQCSTPFEAFSFGISHPATEVLLLGVQTGSAIDPLLGGVDPEYLILDLTPAGGAGYVCACILTMDLSQQLEAGVGHEVLRGEYQVLPGNGSGATSLLPTSALGAPPVELLVITNLVEITPSPVDGVIERIGEDCNGNGLDDLIEIAQGASLDCDGNARPDACDIADGLLVDCDGDLIPDSCAIAVGQVPDCDLDGIPDSCQIASGAPDCDLDGVPD